jgi:predicted ATPase/signal transduction histidine kinase
MRSFPGIKISRAGDFQLAWEDGQRTFLRGWRAAAGGNRKAVLAVVCAAEHGGIDRLVREYELRDELDGAWAAQPRELLRQAGQAVLVLEDHGFEPLDRILRSPMKLGDLLGIAVALSGAVGKMHDRGIIHKDIKPANVLVRHAGGGVWLTGFGIASQLSRERQMPDHPELIAGTLAYMAPEQTGRMNRSIDSRSDLYALGVTLYEMLTGNLPFVASDPVEWVHCHVARQAVPPKQRSRNVPAALSAIVMKLLAKMPEDRYQTAGGVESDLKRCLAEWQSYGRIVEFPLGEHDTFDRLMIPEKLYGRTREIGDLLACFNRVVADGTPELVLVSGYSGIGKSSVVNELHKALVPPRGLFASGKFDQYKRDIPYATLAQAFRSLVISLLGKTDAELQEWRAALHEALGLNGLLVVDLVPELKLIVGEQPEVPELSPQDAQRRFQIVLQRFVGVFARPEHPLALFLDDLQWLDAATLDLFEGLLTGGTVRHLLLIGAYRSNEVDSSHPLVRKLDSIRQSNALVREIVLSPLTGEDLGQLVADTLRCEKERVIPLTRLVHEKTAGNPFFALQFLSALSEEGLLTFDHREMHWSWDLDGIHAKGYTDNVVELMIGKLNRLPLETQKALQQFACLGNVADTTSLGIVCGSGDDEVHDDLWEAERLDYIVRLDGAYKFVHDRIHEAAYSLIPEERRAETHLGIGRLLIALTPPDKQEDTIFEIVSQFNRGAALIVSREEREQVAELNLIAGRRAKGSTAYASAMSYFRTGSALLVEDRWTQRYDLTFALELNRAECEFLTGHHESAGERLSALASRAANQTDRAAVACLQLELHTMQDQSERAVAVCLEYMRQEEGIEWSAHPTDEGVRQEYDRLWRLIGVREIEDLVDLPEMHERSVLATMDVLTRIWSAAFFTDENLAMLIATHMAIRSIEHGNTHASCCGYAWFAIMVGPCFGDYRSTRLFGRLSVDLVEKRALTRFAARVYNVVAAGVIPWVEHISAGPRYLRRSLDLAAKSGDLAYLAYSHMHLNSHLLVCGEPLDRIEAEVLAGLGLVEKARFGLIVAQHMTHLQLTRNLRGLTSKFGSFDDASFSECAFEQRLGNNPGLSYAACWYWIRKMQAGVLANDPAAALAAAEKAEPLLWTSRVVIEHAGYHFYGALARAASCKDACAPHFAALVEHHRQLEKWAEVCSANFADRSALVGAEMARLEGCEIDAERLYERAIQLARAQGFVQNEGLAFELASGFYRTRGFEAFADTYLRAARRCYLRWGALGKVSQLDQLYPHLQEEMQQVESTGTITTLADRLDLATVLKVSRAVSGEMVLENVVDALMRAAIEHAGAERGLMLISRADQFRIEAEARTSGDTVVVQLLDLAATQTEVPESVVHYVARIHTDVILSEASLQNQFCSDLYISKHRPRSILCLPLLNQHKLTGVLYLENRLAPNNITTARLAVLRMLASQAAISLENARLYRDLEDREKEARESERRYGEMQTELARANRFATVGQLSASIAHEVNTPLAAVLINLETALLLLKRRPPDVEELLLLLEDTVKDTTRAGEVVQRIRALIRKAPQRRETFDLNQAIREVITLAQHEIVKDGILLAQELDIGLPLIDGDRVQLQQVMLNLINNAVQAMRGAQRRELLIRTARTDTGDVVVAVSDSGPGLDAPNPERVFEAFYTTKPDGLGMGLSICRSRAQTRLRAPHSSS